MARTNLKPEDFNERIKLHSPTPAEPIDEGLEAAQLFPWLIRPADAVPLTDIAKIKQAANDYFSSCAANGVRPRLNGLALALGVEGPISLQRMAMRRPELRYMISRCLTAIAHGYEEEVTGRSSTGAIFMLKHLPEFDSQERPGHPPIQYFQDKHTVEIHENVAGVQRIIEEGGNLTPREAYMKVIHGELIDEEDIVEGVVYENAPKTLEHILDETKCPNAPDD